MDYALTRRDILKRADKPHFCWRPDKHGRLFAAMAGFTPVGYYFLHPRENPRCRELQMVFPKKKLLALFPL
jgi:hypothetical protein